MGKGSKKQTIGYKYYLGMHNALCHGPIDAITRVTVDDREVWRGHNTGGQIEIDAPNIFGGESREGGVSGLIDIEMGSPSQTQNSYLVSKLGSLIPAYRGVVGAVFRQCYLGNNPYLKPWRFRGQRIHVRQNGVEQWYDEKAEIAPLGQGLVETLTPSDSIYAAALPANSFHPVSVTIGPYDFNVTLVNGSSTFGQQRLRPNDWLYLNGVRYNPGGKYGANDLIDYDEVLYSLDAGDTVVLQLYNEFTGLGLDTIQGQLRVINTDIVLDMNAVHIIRECLTDPDWGMGYTDGDVEDDVWEAAADQIYNEGLGVSVLWDRQIKIEEFIDEVKKHIDAAVYVSRITGKFVIKLIRNDYDPDDLLLLNESNIERIDDPSRSSIGELINSVTVNYWDASTGKDGSLTITDTAMVQTQGAVINTTLQYPGFTNSRNATIAGQRDLKTLSTPGLTCTIYADATAKNLNIGDVFKLSWSKWGVEQQVMRVANIAYGTGLNNQIRIECTQDAYDTNTTVAITVPNNQWEDPSSLPDASEYQLAQEAPYFELVQALGESDIDNKLSSHPEIGFIVTAVSRAPSAINSRLWSDNGSGYEQVGNLDFSPTATLTSDISKTQTAFTVDNMEDLTEVVLGTHVQIGDELMRVDSVDTVTGAMTVGRGVLDTVPQTHSSGDIVIFWDFYAGLDPTEYTEGEEIDIKATPVSGLGVLPLAEAVPMTVTLAQRANRPYAPGDLRINGDSYVDTTYENELTITWTHRDRLQQTGGVLIDHTSGSIGPEAGTTYRLRGYIDEALVHTEDDISGVTTDWTPSDEGLVIVEIHAKRDDIYSWQGAFHQFYYSNGDVLITEEGGERRTEEGVLRVTED